MNLAEKRPLVSIILPTYNEKGNITRLINTLFGLLNDMPVEFLVVDDNSPDGTADEVKKLSSHLPNLHLILRTEDRGLTSAIQRGIDESTGEIIVWMDSDFSMPPEVVPDLVSQILINHMDVAIGSRYKSRGSRKTADEIRFLPRVNRRLSRILNWTAKKISGVTFHDWTSGFIAIRASILQSVRLNGEYGEYFINLMADIIAMNLMYAEVPFKPSPRKYGRSKTADNFFGYLRRGSRYLPAVLRMGYLIRKTTKQGYS